MQTVLASTSSPRFLLYLKKRTKGAQLKPAASTRNVADIQQMNRFVDTTAAAPFVVVAAVLCLLSVSNAQVIQLGNSFPSGMSVGGSSASCNSENAHPEIALVRYNNASKSLEVCDATVEQWIPATSANSSVLSIASLLSTLASIDSAVMRDIVFCSAAGEYSIPSQSCSCYVHNDGDYCEQCLLGWTTPPNSNECSLDIDECATGAHSCDSNAHCTNTDGSYTCTCATGFEGDGESCQDIDSCELNAPTNCAQAPSGGCFDLPAPSLGFECRCVPGYEGDGITCTPCAEGFASNGTVCEFGYAQSCYIDKTVVNVGSSASGVKTLHPTSALDYSIDVYCDQETSGGGWQLFGVFTNDSYPWEFWRGVGVPGNSIEPFEERVDYWSFDILKDLWTPLDPQRSHVSVSIVIQHQNQTQGLFAETQSENITCWTNGIAQFPSRDLLVLTNDELLQSPYQGSLGIKHKCLHDDADWERTLDYVTDHHNARNQYDDNYHTSSVRYAMYHWNEHTQFYYRPFYTYCACDYNPGFPVQAIFWVREEVNECELGIHACHEHADCTDTAGSYECTCKPGYVGDGRTCEEYDACATCLPHGECVDFPPPSMGANCTCHAGYELIGESCVACAPGFASSGTGDMCETGYPQSCRVLKTVLNPSETSGVKTIYPASDKSGPIDVYCDMTTSGGGWMLFGVMVEGAFPWEFFSGYSTPGTSVESFTNRRSWSWNVTTDLYQSPASSKVDLSVTVQHTTQTQTLSAETAASDKNCFTFGVMEFPDRELMVLPQSTLVNPPYQGSMGIKWKCRHSTSSYERTLNYVESGSGNNQYTDTINGSHTGDVWHWNSGPTLYYRPTYTFCSCSDNPGAPVQGIFWVREHLT